MMPPKIPVTDRRVAINTTFWLSTIECLETTRMEQGVDRSQAVEDLVADGYRFRGQTPPPRCMREGEPEAPPGG